MVKKLNSQISRKLNQNIHLYFIQNLETTDEAILDSELLYRKFIIFPDKDRIILRKFDKEVVSASIGFDFEELSFFAESENQRIPIKSFNEYLIPGFYLFIFSFLIDLILFWGI